VADLDDVLVGIEEVLAPLGLELTLRRQRAK
jgi:hypothetical protein